MKKLSWIIPCFNEEEVIEVAVKRILNVGQLMEKYDHELIIVDDGSKDNSREIIKKLNKNDKRINLIGLSRNFGHQAALQAGLDNCSGSAAIIIDADLQDPPEVVLEMVQKWENGFDVVYAKRKERKSEKFFKKITASIFYRFLNLLSDIDIPRDTGDFRLIDKKIIIELKGMREKGRFMRGLISWVGFNQTQVLYSRDERFAGKSKYPIKKMVRLAKEGIISFSNKPLKVSSYLGFLFSLISIVAIFYVVFVRIFTAQWVPGWAFLSIIILLSSGLQMVLIGMLGEYIGSIYLEAKKRPIYIVEEKII